MKLKIMMTGKNKRIALDVSGHLENDRGYTVTKCPAVREALFEMVLDIMPNVIIICLSDETKESVKVYDVLSECVEKDMVFAIVIANDEDTKTFMDHTALGKMFFMPRPVSLMALFSKLMEIQKELDENEGSDKIAGIIEYQKPDSGDSPKYKRKHILVVDDDAMQLLQMKDFLAEFYDVTAVRSGEAALRYLENHQVQMILLDYMMPEMDGPAVLKRLKASEQLRTLPVVFLSGMTEKDAVTKTILELKPQGYLLKPARKSEIIAKIIDVLG